MSAGAARYVADFRTFAGNGAAGAPAWLRELREAGIARFAELDFPTMKHRSRGPMPPSPPAPLSRRAGRPRRSRRPRPSKRWR